MQQIYYSVHYYYNGDPQEQERRLRDATQASLVNLVSTSVKYLAMVIWRET